MIVQLGIAPPIDPALIELVGMIQADEDERWSRACVIARTIPGDVDLSDDADVIRALFAARFCAADFADVLDTAIEVAMFNRGARQ